MEKYEEFARDVLRDIECVKNFLLDRASVFGVSEWVAVKACLLSLGVLLGCSFSKFFKKLKPLMAVVMVLSGAFAFVRIFAPVFDDLRKD